MTSPDRIIWLSSLSVGAAVLIVILLLSEFVGHTAQDCKGGYVATDGVK